MRTLFKFKINTAIIIFMAFIFRLVFVNVSMITPINSKTSKLAVSHFSSKIKKRRKNTEVDAKSSIEKYSATEVCEENLDGEESLIKADLPVLFSFLYSLFNRVTDPIKSNISFDSIKCTLYPKKYLALSTLRI